MKRIIVLGCPGSGKSTFAVKLSKVLNLPLYHLDNIWWKKDRTHISRNEFDEKLQELLDKEQWIIDGDYSRTYEVRIKSADTVIFLDYDVGTCLESIYNRTGKVRNDIPWVETETDEELVRMVKSYNDVNRPLLMELFRKYNDKSIIKFKDRDEAERWLTGLSETTEV